MKTDFFASKIDVQKLVHNLSHDVPKGASDPDSNPQWTISVRNVMHECGREMGFKVESRRTDKNPDCHEWLFDVVWLRNPPDIGMELAAESEWGNPGCVQDDFQKLLSVKAPVKVLLFAYKKGSKDSSMVWDGIKKYMNDYPHHLAGETYIFMEFHKDYCRSAVVHVEKAGKQNFDFQPKELEALLTGG